MRGRLSLLGYDRGADMMTGRGGVTALALDGVTLVENHKRWTFAGHVGGQAFTVRG